MSEIKKHDTLADFVIREFGTMEALFFLAQNEGIAITESVAPGTEMDVEKDDVLLFSIARKKKAFVSIPMKDVDSYELKKHQNNADFVCQHAGSMEYLFEMAMLNGIAITKKPAAGERIKIMEVENRIVAGFRSADLVISSEDDRPGDVKAGGIGYMQIQNNFIVS